MDTKTPGIVQNENLLIHRGKGVNGVKADMLRPEFKMASPTPPIGQNENLHIHRGKGSEGVKADVLKPENRVRRDRKALADLSNAGKPPRFGASKGPTPKVKSAVCSSETTKKALKSNILTIEEIKKCREWAIEGIEHIHFTGNDMQKLEKDTQEECVKKEVEMVMSSLSKWTQMSYDLGMPAKEVSKDIGDITKLELEPEVLGDITKLELEPEVLLPRTSLPSTSGDEEIEDPFLGAEICMFLPYVDHTFELKLKEEY